MYQKKEYMKPETKEVTFFYQQSLLQDASCEDGCEEGPFALSPGPNDITHV
ncbi:MAG: hypothetical protein IKS02_00735 [Fibrobacter sp.]|jgi:hypothetical protein|nr:hypothetical protein [Fibrobacter sp.]